MAEILLKHGADANIQDYYGDTPLHMAQSGNMVDLLLDHGANPAVANSNRQTPIHSVQYEDALKAMLVRGVDIPDDIIERTFGESDNPDRIYQPRIDKREMVYSIIKAFKAENNLENHFIKHA